MTKLFTGLAATVVAVSVLSASAFAQTSTMKPMKSMKPMGKMVSVYQADKCHMYFSPAQAKMYKYACPDSKGKMKMVKVSPAMAKMQIAKTTAMLAPKKSMMAPKKTM